MNRADLVAHAVEHVIPASRLLLFAQVATAGADHRSLVAILSSYRPSEFLAGAGRVVTDDGGITYADLDGERPVTVTWGELTTYLAAAVTVSVGEDLAHAYEASLVDGRGTGGRRLASCRDLAYRVVTGSGLAPPSLFALNLRPRTVLDGRDTSEGFNARVTLNPLDERTVACCVNDRIAAVVRPAQQTHWVTVVVVDGHSTPGSPAADQGTVWRGTVRHVPPGETAGPLPARFTDRVGVEVLDIDAHGARWALQVDGFDTVIMEAGVAGVGTTVRAAVYDNDPTRPFQAFEGQCRIPSLAWLPARSVSDRLAQLRRPSSEGRCR